MRMNAFDGSMRAVGYTRVSTDEQHTRPEDDRARITAACTAYGYELVEFIEDIDVSGKVPLAEREHGRRIHELIETKNPWADVLIVTAIDRLTRNTEDGMALIRRLIPNGGRRRHLLLVSLDDHIDLAGATGRLFAKFRILLSEYERELIGERTSNALQHKRSQGTVYGQVPYGWDRVGDHTPCEPGNCLCQLIPNEGEQAVIREMRHHHEVGRNDGWIADWLNDQGIRGKRGGRWYATSVFNTLQQPKPGP